MFIEQGIKKENHFWKYLVGSLIVIVLSQLGALPLIIGVFIKKMKDGKGMPSEDDFMKTLDSNLTLFLVMLSFVLGLLSLFFVIKKIHNQTILSLTTTRKKLDWSRVFTSFGIWGIFTIFTTYATYYYSPENFVWNFKPIPFAVLAIIAIVMIPIQTSCEEYIFRGYLMQGFGGLFKNKWLPLVLTSVIFGGMHIANPEVKEMGYIIMVYYIGTGFMLGILTLMDEGMELSLGFHAANNLVGALLVTSDWSVFQTNSILRDIAKPEAGMETFIPVFVIYPILLFIFSKIYKWTNWKEKLTGNIYNNNLETIENIVIND
jgi:uncharacterized protein